MIMKKLTKQQRESIKQVLRERFGSLSECRYVDQPILDTNMIQAVTQNGLVVRVGQQKISLGTRMSDTSIGNGISFMVGNWKSIPSGKRYDAHKKLGLVFYQTDGYSKATINQAIDMFMSDVSKYLG